MKGSNKLKKGQKLGSGAYGKVYEAQDVYGNSLAVKRLLVDANNTFSGSIREADLVNRFKHPHIVYTEVKYGTVFDGPLSPASESSQFVVKDDNITLVMEKAAGNTYEYMRQLRRFDDVRTLMVHMLLGVEYMHMKGVTHQDLKPGNILYFVDRNGYVIFKLADLGLAYWNNMYGYQSPMASTSWYRAPEICVGKTRYGHPIDMWSIGCMFYEFLFGNALLANIPDDNAVIMDRYKHLIPGCGGTISWKQFWEKAPPFHLLPNSVPPLMIPHIQSFMSRCLSYKPKDRMTATEALNHPLFMDFQPYITLMRSNYPPFPDTPRLVTTPKCPERQFAIIAANNIIKLRNKEVISEHYRPLFHALMLFDRALMHTLTYCKPRYSCISDLNGLYWSKEGTIIRFMVCYYLAYKYFGLFKPTLQWKELLNDRYCKIEYVKLAEEFEKFLVVDVCNFYIYEPSPIDVAGLRCVMLSNNDVANIFNLYANYSWENVTFDLILTYYLQSKE